MYNNYEDAAEAIVTKAQAVRELARHGASAEDFFSEVGERDSYVGKEVLDYLNY